MSWRFFVGMFAATAIGLGLLAALAPPWSEAGLGVAGLGVALVAVVVGFTWDVRADLRRSRRAAALRFERAVSRS